jgi:hypothetical protein
MFLINCLATRAGDGFSANYSLLNLAPRTLDAARRWSMLAMVTFSQSPQMVQQKYLQIVTVASEARFDFRISPIAFARAVF